MVHILPMLFSLCLCVLSVLCKLLATVGVFLSPPAYLGLDRYIPQSWTWVPAVPWYAVILTLSLPCCRCFYPQPRMPRHGAEGLGAGGAQGSVPPPLCPPNRRWSKRDPVLSAASWAAAWHTRACESSPGLGADPEEAREGLGWHVRPVRYAQDCEDCVIAEARQPSWLSTRLALGSFLVC